TRREFLKKSALSVAGAGLAINYAAAGLAQPAGASERVHVGVMGVNGRGSALARVFANHPQSQVDYICDVDEEVMDEVVDGISEIGDN
ncbi:MAG: twin-arginine translocation signal domain-containing protein, partial [candidate division Zixibacteria bacterium]|nr:twin-arginine translocation signal domain-containing protein [candidate division Zixibacteria bacterium]NIS45610.1 twin-arginine translocation signal domain-containing protein [candidate division Zixibacteria bacterium]NIV05776.1 twin-arginine translocation signal domain-containing protein [candidate division Zixibacteria bacterium]NIW44599.1 twin-arginine translocation signal domain-containing protein [Gammaproteobacteria bacterium]NIX55732.1 twin-arginine translocation signal domain-contai